MTYVIGRVLDADSLPLSGQIPPDKQVSRIKNLGIRVGGLSAFQNGRLQGLDPDNLPELYDLKRAIDQTLRTGEALRLFLTGTIIRNTHTSALAASADVSFYGGAHMYVGQPEIFCTSATPLKATPWEGDAGFETDLTVSEYNRLGRSAREHIQLVGHLGLNAVHLIIEPIDPAIHSVG